MASHRRCLSIESREIAEEKERKTQHGRLDNGDAELGNQRRQNF